MSSIGVKHAMSVIIEHARHCADAQSDLDKERNPRDQRVAMLLMGLFQEAGISKYELGALVTAQDWLTGSRSGDLVVVYDGG